MGRTFEDSAKTGEKSKSHTKKTSKGSGGSGESAK